MLAPANTFMSLQAAMMRGKEQELKPLQMQPLSNHPGRGPVSAKRRLTKSG